MSSETVTGRGTTQDDILKFVSEAAHDPLANGEEAPPEAPEEAPLSPPESHLAACLAWLLQSLFCLNGLVLALESLPLMFIINTRVEIPLAYLPTYGAVAFLPYSLKPIYAYLSSQDSNRLSYHYLYPLLMTASGICTLATTLIPTGGVAAAFVLAFLRGITDSWSELCLGLTLIDHAQKQQSMQQRYDVLASLFQSQAATARNVGSLLGISATCALFVQRQVYHSDANQLSGAVADALLIATGSLRLAGAVFAMYYRGAVQCSSAQAVSFSLIQQTDESEDLDTNHSQHQTVEVNNFQSAQQDAFLDEESALRDDDGNSSHPSYSSHEDEDNLDIDSLNSTSSSRTEQDTLYSRATNLSLVVALQLVIIAFAMKGPFESWTMSTMAWKIIVVALLTALFLLAWVMWKHDWWRKPHRVGLFLILRHATPSASMLLYSFYYFLFQSSPLLLQLLSLIGQGASTFSSWSYGKLLARFSSGNPFLAVVAVTTVLAALASLSNLALVGKSSSNQLGLFWLAGAIRLLTTFFTEWAFLPDVIIATTSSVSQEQGLARPRVSHRTVAGADANPAQERFVNEPDERDSSAIAVKYGTMISCIDFGDQLGSMLAGPLVVFLGISRENDFLHLDRLILICSTLSVMALPALLLIRSKR